MFHCIIIGIGIKGRVYIMELYRRENYLKKIRGFYHDSEMIKVITGVRRCGKSSLMQTIVEELKEQGVPEAMSLS